jgi:virulence-associated protein VagC
MKLVENIKISKELQYHIDNNLPLTENIFRVNSEKFYQLVNEVRELFNNDKIRLTETDIFLVETDLGKSVKLSNGETIWLDAPIVEEEMINETIKLDIKVGDTLMGGKFKNKKVVVKTIDKNEKGDITINGSPLLRFRMINEVRVPRDERVELYRDENILVIVPLTHRALKKYANSCQWCINSDVSEWEDYHKGLHAIIIQRNLKKPKIGITGNPTPSEIFLLAKWDNNESTFNDVCQMLGYKFNDEKEMQDYYITISNDINNFGTNIVYYSPEEGTYDQEDNFLMNFNYEITDIPNVTPEIVKLIDEYVANQEVLSEAQHKGKNVELNKPKRGGAKKYYVYVKNPSTGNIKKISFGDVHGGLTAKVSNPKARKAFAARHNCKDKKDKTKAGYWACRANRYANLWNGRTYPGFW